jgi:hypothetical protein
MKRFCSVAWFTVVTLPNVFPLPPDENAIPSKAILTKNYFMVFSQESAALQE